MNKSRAFMAALQLNCSRSVLIIPKLRLNYKNNFFQAQLQLSFQKLSFLPEIQKTKKIVPIAL